MQKVLSKYALAAHLALLAVAPLFLFPFCGPRTTATSLLFLSLFAAFWMLLEPSRRSDELLHGARIRVFRANAADPLFWIFLVLAVYGAMRWLNGGVATVFYPAETVWRVRPPYLEGLPGSVDGEGYLPFAAIVAAAVVVQGCRHSLGKAARLAFATTASVLAGCAALAAMWAAYLGHAGACAAMEVSWRNASFVGAAFGMHCVGGLVALSGFPERKWMKSLLLISFAAGSCGCGLFYFAPVPVTAAFAAAALVVVLASFVYVWMTMTPPDVLKCFAGVVVAAGVGVAIALAAAPQEITDARLDAVVGGFFPEGFAALRERLSEIASSIWRDRVWLGAGAGSMPLEIRYCATAADWASWGVAAPSAVPNGWWQIVAERGILGALALGVPFAVMSVTFVLRIVRADRRAAFLPLAFGGVAVVAAVAAETFVDSSILRPEALTAAGAYFALAGSAFPQAKKTVDEDES